MKPTAVSALPAETPTSPGSASGFRNSPCITAPLTPSAAPTRSPRSTRGSRTYRSTTACCIVYPSAGPSPSCARTMAATSPGVIATLPTPRLSSVTPTSAAARPEGAHGARPPYARPRCARPPGTRSGSGAGRGRRSERRRGGAGGAVIVGPVIGLLRVTGCVGVERPREGEDVGAEAGAEVERVVGQDDDPAVPRRGRGRERRLAGERLGAAHRLGRAAEHEDDVGRGLDQRLGRHRLVALDGAEGVLAAGEPDEGVGLRAGAGEA